MKRIGIIKLFLPLDFSNEFIQSTGYNEETLLTAKILQDNGAEITILSANNLSTNVENTFKFSKNFIDGWSKNIDLNRLDEILVFNSKNKIEESDDSSTKRLYFSEVTKYKQMLKLYRNKLSYIITDLNCIDDEIVNTSDLVISQALYGLRNIDLIQQKYLPIDKLPILINSNTTTAEINKVVYFGNNRVDRQSKFDSYFSKDLHVYGKGYSKEYSDYVDNDITSVDFKNIENIMNKYEYSLVITDEEYSRNNFQTPRYFECIRRGLLTFVDKTYANTCDFVIPSYMIVENKYDVNVKMETFTDEHKKLILNEQNNLIKNLKVKIQKTFSEYVKWD